MKFPNLYSIIPPNSDLYPDITPHTLKTLELIRDPDTFKWYLIPMIIIVLYIFINEWSKENKSVVLGAAAFWGADLFNEIWNGIFFHLTKTAPVWGVPGNDSGFIIFAGLNIEISIMFAVLGICAVKMLPKEKTKKIFRVNNRVFLAVFGAAAAVGVEIILNLAGALTWEWPYWNAKFPYLIFLIGYLPFFTAAYFVHDLKSTGKQILTVSSILSFNLILIIIFGFYLNWL
jgi:hypothetical protein